MFALLQIDTLYTPCEIIKKIFQTNKKSKRSVCCDSDWIISRIIGILTVCSISYSSKKTKKISQLSITGPLCGRVFSPVTGGYPSLAMPWGCAVEHSSDDEIFSTTWPQTHLIAVGWRRWWQGGSASTFPGYCRCKFGCTAEWVMTLHTTVPQETSCE